MSLHLDTSEPVAERRAVRFFGSPDTDVGLLLSAVLGLALTLIAFAFLWQTRQSPVSAMFFQKSPIISWVPPLEVYVASWGLAILILKFRLRRKQERFLESVVLSELPESISPEAAASFLQRMEVSEPKWSKSLLFHRIAKLLAHFEVTQDRSEIAALSTSQSDIDGTTLRSSYTMVKVFVWAIPILGFIGTVIGLQEAIRGFAGLSNVDRLQEQLAPITSGLGGAFQATLIALALSLLLMFPSSASERAEWRFLNKIDDFCNDQILRRLFLPLQQTQGSLVDRSELKFLANQIASELAASITLTIPKMAGVLYSELTSAERVQTLVTSLFQQILINSGKVIEGALSSQVTELKALSVSIQDDTKQRVESVELQSRILQTMTDAQSSMRETLEALQSATDGIGRVVTQVDAQQELDGVHKALERVSQLLHNGAPAAKTFNATSDGINRRG